jgi:NAD(P)-dependent dehydrogenase (short-subunit alcohol dehydrogenase family)
MVAFGPFEDFELDLWRQVQAVNVESALLLTQAFGRVVFIVSNTFWRPPGAHMLAYAAPKGALTGITHALAVGLGGHGIAVTAVAPGLTRTSANGVVPTAEFEESRRSRRCPGRSPPTTPQPWWRCSSGRTPPR